MERETYNKYRRDLYHSNLEHERERCNKKNTNIRKRNQQYVLEYLKTHPCVDCGISNPVVLEFDHVRGEKKKAVTDLVPRNSIEVIQKEIDKCEVRCANCHRIKTAKERGYYKELNKES